MEGNATVSAGVAIAMGIVGVAIVALIVSQRSQTPGVLKSLGSAIQTILCVATSPVTGGKCVTNVTSSISFGSVG